MYTVCWTFTHHDSVVFDKWERCDDRREVAALLIREGLEDDPDVLIFGPDADDALVDVEDIFAAL